MLENRLSILYFNKYKVIGTNRPLIIQLIGE
jgi:hypothetical protein